MFYVKNADFETMYKTENFEQAKRFAYRMKAEIGENFTIEEVKTVYTTQSIDEAIGTN